VATAEERVGAGSLRQRRMLEDDIGSVIELEREAYQFPWSEGIFRDCLRVGYTCRVIDAADGIGGYGIMSLGAGEAHILNLCVREDLRSRGVGRQLLHWLLRRAAAVGMEHGFLEVRPSNLAAMHLYEATGFEAVGRRRGYYQAIGGREDAIVYRLDLRRWAQRGG
jgi:ribosomal-protein-alanine N-acetyltransferase